MGSELDERRGLLGQGWGPIRIQFLWPYKASIGIKGNKDMKHLLSYP